MIVGFGIDLCNIGRIARAIDRHQGGFEKRLFTEQERDYCRGRASPAQHFAARFAAKEALFKALGGPSGLSWHELEVVSDEHGSPRIRLSGAAREAARRRGARQFHVSLTHEKDTAAALVIAEGDEPRAHAEP
ncbi:holo-ACP synthase [Sorangium sp. So ce185]|uniref:holo-ACP synthase n=1 Tax=Sorangium sp. So ce185 TaxID=3133287 RepID=UPI003F62DAD7